MRRYFTPFAFLALIPIGAWLGTGWTFTAAAATPIGLLILDAALGDGPKREKKLVGRAARWLPISYVVLQLSANVYAALVVMRPGTSLVEAVGLALSAGVTTGVFGFVAAHELIHSRDPRERGVGLVLLASVFYAHFRIAHIHGHHRRAATFKDPASARLGEGLYTFLVRSIRGQLHEAWGFEARRLRRAGTAVIGVENRMILYFASEAALLVALALIGWRLLAFTVTVAAIAIALLEAFNYVAHYGLSRRRSAVGRLERIAPQHSWNTGKRMNNAALFNMGRHSDHHRHAVRSFEQLERLPAGPDLPFGYAGALLMALIPPIWRRIMDPRAIAAAPPQESTIREEANGSARLIDLQPKEGHESGGILSVIEQRQRARDEVIREEIAGAD